MLHSRGQSDIKGASVPAPSKRDKQSHRKHEQTKAVRTRLKNVSKNFYRALDAGDTERAAQLRDEAQQAYDKAATKGVIHSNKAARKTSRLDKALAGTNAPTES
jgi:small subunit ribosomal protein S20